MYLKYALHTIAKRMKKKRRKQMLYKINNQNLRIWKMQYNKGERVGNIQTRYSKHHISIGK